MATKFWQWASFQGQEAEIEEKKLPELSEEEKQQILASEPFQHFFDRASRIVERALTEEVYWKNR